MTYELLIGHPHYSSWSLRAWLILARAGLPHHLVPVDIYRGGKARDLAPVVPADTVPVLRLPDDTAVGDSLAIAETLHDRQPNAGLWPRDPAARARDRWLTAEMHAGFAALRADCPMVLTHRITNFAPSDAVRRDLDRLATLWAWARAAREAEGPWLCGAYSIADAFYAPVALRVVGYGLPLAEAASAYVAAHAADPAIAQWRAMGDAAPLDPAPYAVPGERAPWPAL